MVLAGSFYRTLASCPEDFYDSTSHVVSAFRPGIVNLGHGDYQVVLLCAPLAERIAAFFGVAFD